MYVLLDSVLKDLRILTSSFIRNQLSFSLYVLSLSVFIPHFPDYKYPPKANDSLTVMLSYTFYIFLCDFNYLLFSLFLLIYNGIDISALWFAILLVIKFHARDVSTLHPPPVHVSVHYCLRDMHFSYGLFFNGI